MGILLLFKSVGVSARTGSVVTGFTMNVVTGGIAGGIAYGGGTYGEGVYGAAGGGIVTAFGRTSASFTLGAQVTPSSPPTPPGTLYPDVVYQVAFASQPLATAPVWVDVSSRLRAVGSQRGRSYEFDREETGTSEAILSNRDAALSPSNTASPYAPVKSTRPVRSLLNWHGLYPLFRGISEGFPQNYPALGKDALVQLRANDLFYGLNNSRFTPASTMLYQDLDESSPYIPVSAGFDLALPWPQTLPFQIQVGDERMNVTGAQAGSFTAERGVDGTVAAAHSSGAAVNAFTVIFGEAYSGERIRQVLEAVGFDSSWYDLNAGQSLIAQSEDLIQVSPLEHINLIAEAEFGRFFVSRAGKFTFKDRDSVIVDNLTPVMTFGTTAGQVPFSLAGELEHSEEKLYNRVKITIQGGAYNGQVIDVSDATSIANHFERVFERAYPYANINDADSAARFVLARNAEATLRLPGIVVKPAINPSTLWPQVLARELGERVRFQYQPEAGGTAIDTQLIIEGIAHDIQPREHTVTFQCTQVDSAQYWLLGVAGYTELGTTTRVGF